MTTPLSGAAIGQLDADGLDTVVGTFVSPSGLTHAKTVPARRLNAFADPGLGFSLSPTDSPSTARHRLRARDQRGR